MFVRDDWTLFRNLGTLGQKAGVGKERLAALVMKELVDNALDAAGDGRVGSGPAERSFFVEDEGPGIAGTDEELCSLFSIRRPLTSTKLYRLPTRGALGNGLRVVTGAVLASGGTLAVRTMGRRLELRPTDDGMTTVVDRRPEEGPGTRVDISFGKALDIQYALGLANLAVRMKGTPYEGKSSPWWYDSDSFYELCSAADFHLYDLLENLVGRYPIGEARISAGLPPVDAETTSFDRETAEKVLGVLRNSVKAPKPAVLGSVGEFGILCDGYSRKSDTIFLEPAIGSLKAQIPVVVEAWANRLERGQTPKVRIYVNRTPIVAHVGAGTIGGKKRQMWVNGCGINHYFKAGRDPVQIDLCITSPYMPITTDGKEPNLEPLLSEVFSAVESATRKAQRKGPSGESRTTKIDAVVSLLPEAMSDASGGGKHRFSLRQLYYAVRPLLQATGDEDELTYTYFAQIITKHEASIGHDLPDIYRDARGTLYHPHTGQSISVGTLSIEKYERPEWTFNKILYIEKGGFFPLLIDEKWPERHDCALLTSQGFATRAARDVIDLLGETDEPVQFYCIHDADAFGSNIHTKLVEATLARPARKVEVTNLGLDPWEAKEMGLLPERLVRKDEDDLAVAPYVRRYDRENGTDWRDWLQHSRYELNAMSSPQFLDWLDDKMASQEGKVVPPPDVLVEVFRGTAEENVRKLILDRLAREHKVDDQVKRFMANLAAWPDPSLVLDEAVRLHFHGEPADSWKVPIGKAADEAAIRLVGP